MAAGALAAGAVLAIIITGHTHGFGDFAKSLPRRTPEGELIEDVELHDVPLHEAHPPECKTADAPSVVWGPTATGPMLEFSVMTYNLFWWNLFDHAKGPWGHKGEPGNPATELIMKALEKTPYDMLGFQECEDEDWLLSRSGMALEFEIFRDRACCFAYRKRKWQLLERGVNYVADDAKYGMRPAQWMRLQHIETGKIVFFINHHGPLPISSGGMCGGRAHAFNILKIYETEAQRGDVVILVGDFNAEPSSATIQVLKQRLHVAAGGWRSVTHIDYIFSNTGPEAVVAAHDLGAGGSDHHAFGAEFRVGQGVLQEVPSPVEVVETPVVEKPAQDDQCSPKNIDQFEYGINYVPPAGAGRLHLPNVDSPDTCCMLCRARPKCEAFSWNAGGSCWLWGHLPTQKQEQDGAVSGVPHEAEEVEEVYDEEVDESQEVKAEEQNASPKESADPHRTLKPTFSPPVPAQVRSPEMGQAVPQPSVPQPAVEPVAPEVYSPAAYHMVMSPAPASQGGLQGFVAGFRSWLGR